MRNYILYAILKKSALLKFNFSLMGFMNKHTYSVEIIKEFVHSSKNWKEICNRKEKLF